VALYDEPMNPALRRIRSIWSCLRPRTLAELIAISFPLVAAPTALGVYFGVQAIARPFLGPHHDAEPPSPPSPLSAFSEAVTVGQSPVVSAAAFNINGIPVGDAYRWLSEASIPRPSPTQRPKALVAIVDQNNTTFFWMNRGGADNYIRTLYKEYKHNRGLDRDKAAYHAIAMAVDSASNGQYVLASQYIASLRPNAQGWNVDTNLIQFYGYTTASALRVANHHSLWAGDDKSVFNDVPMNDAQVLDLYEGAYRPGSYAGVARHLLAKTLRRLAPDDRIAMIEPTVPGLPGALDPDFGNANSTDTDRVFESIQPAPRADGRGPQALHRPSPKDVQPVPNHTTAPAPAPPSETTFDNDNGKYQQQNGNLDPSRVHLNEYRTRQSAPLRQGLGL
jgi:hypothetical protein